MKEQRIQDTSDQKANGEVHFYGEIGIDHEQLLCLCI